MTSLRRSRYGPYDRQTGLNTPPTPDFRARFAKCAAELVRHGADAVEIWNEPNSNGFYRPEADPKAWAELVVATADAIKAVDPKEPRGDKTSGEPDFPAQ